MVVFLFQSDDKRFLNGGDTSYYNVPSSIPVPVVVPTTEDRNNNDYDGGYFTAEKETCYDIITSTIFVSVISLR